MIEFLAGLAVGAITALYLRGQWTAMKRRDAYEADQWAEINREALRRQAELN